MCAEDVPANATRYGAHSGPTRGFFAAGEPDIASVGRALKRLHRVVVDSAATIALVFAISSRVRDLRDADHDDDPPIQLQAHF